MSVEKTDTKPHCPEKMVIRLKFFGLITCRPEEFVEELEKLCDQFTDSKDEYSYSWDTDFAA